MNNPVQLAETCHRTQSGFADYEKSGKTLRAGEKKLCGAFDRAAVLKDLRPEVSFICRLKRFSGPA